MQAIQPPQLPVPKPALSPGMRTGSLVFVSGQVAFDAGGEVVHPNDMGKQTAYVLEAIRTILAEAGADLSDVVKTTVYIQDFAEFDAYDAAYAEAFGGHRPARETVGATLVKPEIRIEISAVAEVA
jgi:reactive intermediate/imine deaminase